MLLPLSVAISLPHINWHYFWGAGQGAGVDGAMLGNKGGIDFNSDKMNLEIQNGGGEIKFKIDAAMLQQLQNAPGFMPVIINIKPLSDIPTFLGIFSVSK